MKPASRSHPVRAAVVGAGLSGLTAGYRLQQAGWDVEVFESGPEVGSRVRTVADGVSPSLYGRREAFQVKRALEAKGPVTIPREFVFMDRAAIGLGSAFLRLGAALNWRRLFETSLEGFSEAALAERQRAALAAAGLA